MKSPNRHTGMTDETALERNAPAVVKEVINIAPAARRCTQLMRDSSGVPGGRSTADWRQASTKTKISSAPIPQMTSNCNNNRRFFNRNSSSFRGNSPLSLHCQSKNSKKSVHLCCNSQQYEQPEPEQEREPGIN